MSVKERRRAFCSRKYRSALFARNKRDFNYFEIISIVIFLASTAGAAAFIVSFVERGVALVRGGDFL